MNRRIITRLAVFFAVAVSLLHAYAASPTQLSVDNINTLGGATFFGPVTISGDTVTNNLQLYYKLNTNGTYVIDDSGHASRTGTIVSATWTSNGISSGAYDFSSVSSNRIAFSESFMDGATAFTCCAWVKENGNPTNWQKVIGAESDSGGGDRTPISLLWLNKNGLGTNAASYMWIHPSTGGFKQVTIDCGKPTTYFFDGQWHFVALQWNGTIARHYIDGDYDTEITNTPSGGSLGITNRLSYIGNAYAGGGVSQNWNGQIDEVRIYDRYLSEAELQAVWAHGTNDGGPVALTVSRLDSVGAVVQTSITPTNAFMGNTGIGTNGPIEKLDVAGKLNMQDNIKLNSNWLSHDGGNEGLYVSASGQVGIGTNGPSDTLHIPGTLRVSNGVTYMAPLGGIPMGSFTNTP